MNNSTVTKPILRWSALLKGARQVMAGFSLAAGLTIAGSTLVAAEPIAAVQAPRSSLPDGVYLYGQSPEPEVIGQGYFVFEVKQGDVVGALYMPRSSFDCASGAFSDRELTLTVVNSYDRTTNPFEIAVEKTANVASTGNPAQSSINLQGFHRIETVSENDQRILSVCKSDLQQHAKATTPAQSK